MGVGAAGGARRNDTATTLDRGGLIAGGMLQTRASVAQQWGASQPQSPPHAGLTADGWQAASAQPPAAQPQQQAAVRAIGLLWLSAAM